MTLKLKINDPHLMSWRNQPKIRNQIQLNQRTSCKSSLMINIHYFWNKNSFTILYVLQMRYIDYFCKTLSLCVNYNFELLRQPLLKLSVVTRRNFHNVTRSGFILEEKFKRTFYREKAWKVRGYLEPKFKTKEGSLRTMLIVSLMWVLHLKLIRGSVFWHGKCLQ